MFLSLQPKSVYNRNPKIKIEVMRFRHFFMLLAAMILTCCSSDNEMKAETPSLVPATGETGKTLVAYYSYTGNCRSIVNELTKQLEADVLEITPVDKSQRYEADNYAVGTQLLNAIKANPDEESSYPPIDPVSVSLDGYDNVIIVTPLWWSQMAAIMQTYLFQNAGAMAGKHVALIVSSHSSSIGGVERDVRRLLPDVEWMGDALWINNSNRSKTVSLLQQWLPNLNFKTSLTAMKMTITIGGNTMTATLADNSSARALYAALQQAPITYEAHDYGDFEKVGPLGQSFPQNNESITTEPGDLILYQGDNLCIYYDVNTWSFTRIGRIDNATQTDVRNFVKAGQGNVTVTLAVAVTTDLRSAEAPENSSQAYIGMNGVATSHPVKGVYIKDGKKKKLYSL